MPSPPVVAKLRYFQYHNWRRHISHSYMNHQVPEVSLEELLLSRPICCELSRLRCHGHSLLLSSYLHRKSRKENSACSVCGYLLQDLNHLLLKCPASEPLRKFIFGSSLSILDLCRGGVEDARLEAKAKDTKKIRGHGQGQECSRPRPRTKNSSASALRKKKVFPKIFQAISKKKRFPKNFQAFHKILTIQKIVLSSSRVQANFLGLEA